ncbi:uncharacterized protein GO595_004174 [Histomonas meleagridis]|uniref:uncharacterized protein n=1 Tax=Histomonas meleagridis TaxID=135588 RepID=UPI0035593C1A|nr:hypothetical protein GO595_004174 [Histomonas meleagridis]
MLTQKRKKWDDGTIVENSIYKSEEGVPPVGEDLRVGKLIVNIDSYDSGSTEEKKEEPPPPPPRTLVRPIRTAGANRFVAPRSIPLHQTRNSPEKQSPERTHVPHLNVQVQPSPIKSSQPVITVPEEPPKTILVKPRTFDEILNFYSDNPSPLDQFKVTKSINEITLTHETNLSSIKESMQDGTKRKRPDESLSYEDFPVDPNTDFKSPQRTTGYESTDVNQTKDNIIAISWGGKLAPKVPTVPFEFECLDDYKTAFLDGISYELNYKINEVYKMYVAALFSASNKAPRCKAHGPAAFNVDKKGNYYYKCKQCNFYQPIQPDIITPSRRDVRSIATVINFMHVRNISYHESTLIRKNNVYTLYFFRRQT